MSLALVLALAVGSVQGVATIDGDPLPGCTVTLTAAGLTQQRVADVEGRYRFPAVEPGRYELTFELAGLETLQRAIEVVEGVNEQPPADLAFDETMAVTISCGGPPCNDTDPETPWSWPSCTDYELDEALIESMERGDLSALALLRDRYSRAFTYAQKHRIAEALLGRVRDDRVYWDELYEHARNAVRFFTDDEHSDEYLKWCAERRYDPDEYIWMSTSALFIAAQDRRSLALLLQALERDEATLIDAAIYGLATQHDLLALPAIERALERYHAAGGEMQVRAYGLVVYRHDDADRIAFKYLDEEGRGEYLQARNAPPEEALP